MENSVVSSYSDLLDKTNRIFIKLLELESKEDIEPKYYMQRLEEQPVQTMSLRIVPSAVVFFLKRLLLILTGMIAEKAMLEIDKKTETRLLKNMVWAGVYALDQLKSSLSQYSGIKCLSVSNNKLTCTFKSPLDLGAVEDILNNPHSSINQLVVERREENRILNYYLMIDGRDVLVVSNYSISFVYKVMADEWEEYLQMFVEIIARVHRDLLYREGLRNVFMNTYNAFYRLMSPEMFNDSELTSWFESVRKLLFAGGIQKDKSFSETKKSALYHKTDKLYRLVQPLSHLNYIVVCPDKQELYISFRPFFDFKAIGGYLEKTNLSLENRKEGVAYKKVLKKGAGRRKSEGIMHITFNDVINQKKQRIASFDGQSIIVLYLADQEIFAEGLQLFNYIYYNWIYYTSWIPTADVPHSDLDSVDRTVITNIDTLFHIYSTFLGVILSKEYFHSDRMNTLTTKEWLINFLSIDPASRYEEKMLHLLQFMKDKINLQEFLSHTTGDSFEDDEARKRLIDLYAKLCSQLSLTQAYVNSL